MGNLLGSPVLDKETHVGSTKSGLEFGVSSMQGWRVHMEDAHICEPTLYAGSSSHNTKVVELKDHSLFAVFDGHGGSFAADYSGLNLLRVLSRQDKFVQYANFNQEREVKEAQLLLLDPKARATYLQSGLLLLEGALRDAFVELDYEIFRATRGHVEPDANTPYHATTQQQQPNPPTPNDDEDSGTTIVVVITTPHWIVCANAGDSRAVFSKQNNKAVPLSYDHKPDDEDELRRIRAAGGHVAGGRVEGDLAVSRGLGDYRFKVAATVLQGNTTPLTETDDSIIIMKPDDQKVSPIPDIIVQNRSTEQDEFIIVACDGIWDVQTNYECVKMVADIFGEGETDLGLASEEVCLSWL